MSLVLRPLIFKYPLQGQTRELITPIQDGWVPMKMLTAALGLDWKTQRVHLNTLPYVQGIPLAGLRGKPALCMQTEHVPSYLKGISINRVKYPETVRYFQTYFPAALDSYKGTLPELSPDPEPEIVPVAEAEHWDKDKVDEFLRSPEIRMYTETSHTDWLRRDLVTIGIRNFDELNYLMRGAVLTVCKPNPDPKIRSIVTYPVLPSSYYPGRLQALARQGYYPLPEFYRRHPTYYEQDITEAFNPIWVESDESEHLVGAGVKQVRRPAALAPWNTDEFAEKISVRLALLARLDDERFRKNLEEQAALGENILQAAWDSLEEVGDILWNLEEDYSRSFEEDEEYITA